jgi:hypothetical protein
MAGMITRNSTYLLKSPVLGLHDQQTLVTIPAGSTVTVRSAASRTEDPKEEIAVEWDGKILVVFGIDLKERVEAQSSSDSRESDTAQEAQPPSPASSPPKKEPHTPRKTKKPASK